MSVVATKADGQQLTSIFSLMTHSNQILADEQDRSALAAQRALDQVTGTIQALTQENGALKAKLVETDARIAQQQANFDTQLNAMQQLIQQQGQMFQALTTQTTSIQEQLNLVRNCAAACKGYILAIYGTLWGAGNQPNIPNP